MPNMTLAVQTGHGFPFEIANGLGPGCQAATVTSSEILSERFPQTQDVPAGSSRGFLGVKSLISLAVHFQSVVPGGDRLQLPEFRVVRCTSQTSA